VAQKIMEGTMRNTDFTAKLADEVPDASTLTDYDEEHFLT
jgi:hypothetical protein